MTIDISNPDNWRLVWNGEYQQQLVPGTIDRFYPIGTINVPVILSSPFLLINVNSVNAPLNWKTAGYIRQIFPSPVIGSASNANFDSKRIYLHRLTLLEFSQINPTYQTLIDIPYWILDINLSMFQFEPD
jgi:hypothetical protein